MKRILLFTLCLAMLLSVVGCAVPGSSEPTPPATEPDPSAAPSTPDETDPANPEESPYVEDATFRYLYASEIGTMNYLKTGTTADFKPAANFVDTLIEYDQYGVVKPCLATEWSVSDDGLVWTLKLREGDTVAVRRSRSVTRLVKLKNMNFYKILNQKLATDGEGFI